MEARILWKAVASVQVVGVHSEKYGKEVGGLKQTGARFGIQNYSSVSSAIERLRLKRIGNRKSGLENGWAN